MISTVATFAANWLASRLGSFQIAHPNLAVRLETTGDLVDFSREEVDLGIRSGGGRWPGLAAHRLLRAEFTPMLSPALAASIGGVEAPADLLKLPLIGRDDPWWRQWFEAAGVSFESQSDRPASRMGAQTYEGTAALAGQGVAILTRALFVDELGEGRLVQPFPMTAGRRPCLLAGLSGEPPQPAEDPRLPRLDPGRDGGVQRPPRAAVLKVLRRRPPGAGPRRSPARRARAA